ncbi:P-loop containing nucleoside triphosphate hydrolase protein [Dissophora ornata]|nr:P-loop containing nucleoside triphosphate hydrolase protein [Dissophora ornata]
MSNGKRPINISLGGASGLGAKPNPFARNTRPRASKSALGFQDDEDDDEDEQNSTSGPPNRKLIKLDHTPVDHNPPDKSLLGGDDDEDDAFSKLASAKAPPSLRTLTRVDDDEEDDTFSKLTAAKVPPSPPPPLRKPMRGGDEDDDGDAFSRLDSKKGTAKDTKTEKGEEEEEDDPLDAFMAGIDTQVQEEAEKPSAEKIRRDDIEDEDDLESYVKHLKKKGIKIGQGGPVQARNEDIDSDEEVYATARAIDNAADSQYEGDDTFDHTAKVEITPLPRMDHSRQDYIEIEKFFYEEHEDIAKLSDDQVRQIRIDMDMKVSGADVAKPSISFAHFVFDEPLMETIRRAGYTEPSGIQRQAIPVALSGRDIIGIAKTGSGKTAAFLLPMIVHIMDQPELEKGDGPIGVIIAPTRELADQIYGEAKRFARAYSLRVAVVYGGASKRDQFQSLRSGVEILVATPGRLIDMVKMKATNFRRTSFLVLDEADRAFDLGFEPQVRSICDNIRPDRQTLLFSATFQPRVERLAREVMTDPVRISIGNIGQINPDVTQVIKILIEDTLKWSWLMENLQEFESLGSVIIFVSRKNDVVELTENLKKAGVKCECLHGDMLQPQREKAVHDYKAKLFPTLIATDVAGRGLDIKSIRTVVNYDVARDIDSHIHRVGRTGRAGEKGTAYTLLTEKDDRFAGDLVRNLEEFGGEVSPDVMKIAMKNSRFRKSRQFVGGGGGHRGGRGGRGERGRGREHSYSSSSNNTPLGQGDRRHQSHQGGDGGREFGSSDGSRSSGSGYRVSGFQKASRPETGAYESSSPSSTSRSDPSLATTPSAPSSKPPLPGQNYPLGQRPPPSHADPRPPAQHHPQQHAQAHQRPPPPPLTSYGHLPQNRPPHPYHPQHPPPPRPLGGPPPGFPMHGHPHPPPPGFPYPPPPPPGGFSNQQRPPFPPPPLQPHLYGPPPGFPPHGQQGNPRPPMNPPGQSDSADRRRRWDN